MLNNFCFHLYAQNSLFNAENCNGFFWTPSPSSPSPVSLEFIELVPKNLHFRNIMGVWSRQTLEKLSLSLPV